MISDYTTLQSALLDWLDRDDMTAVAPTLVQLGENRIYRELRLRSMEATLNVTIAAGIAPIPADFLELKEAHVLDNNISYPLHSETNEFIYRKYQTRSSDSMPRYISQEGDNFIFGPYPDTTYTIRGTYYKRLTALSASNTSNYFTGNGADLLFWASLAEAELYLKNDNRTVLWEQKYQQARAMITKERNRERTGNGPHRSVGG
jgi:hypothetical protein